MAVRLLTWHRLKGWPHCIVPVRFLLHFSRDIRAPVLRHLSGVVSEGDSRRAGSTASSPDLKNASSPSSSRPSHRSVYNLCGASTHHVDATFVLSLRGLGRLLQVSKRGKSVAHVLWEQRRVATLSAAISNGLARPFQPPPSPLTLQPRMRSGGGPRHSRYFCASLPLLACSCTGVPFGRRSGALHDNHLPTIY